MNSKDEVLHVRIPEEMKEDIEQAAERRSVTTSEWVRAALRNGLKPGSHILVRDGYLHLSDLVENPEDDEGEVSEGEDDIRIA